mmetsp:Transcript_7999/g.24708  ORF Transcript_7999/g.24708 Transcript_7999/m.24708 type:complete len:244 (-) Transcript_7999:357-1088(-)
MPGSALAHPQTRVPTTARRRRRRGDDGARRAGHTSTRRRKRREDHRERRRQSEETGAPCCCRCGKEERQTEDQEEEKGSRGGRRRDRRVLDSIPRDRRFLRERLRGRDGRVRRAGAGVWRRRLRSLPRRLPRRIVRSQHGVSLARGRPRDAVVGLHFRQLRRQSARLSSRLPGPPAPAARIRRLRHRHRRHRRRPSRRPASYQPRRRPQPRSAFSIRRPRRDQDGRRDVAVCHHRRLLRSYIP